MKVSDCNYDISDYVGTEPTYCWGQHGEKYLCRLDYYQTSGYWGWNGPEPPEQYEDIIELMPIVPTYKCWGKGVKSK